MASPEEVVFCVYCKIEKSSTDFPTHRLESTGRIAPCKICRRIEQRISHYSMSLFDFYVLWNEQDGKCAICCRELNKIKFVIDHCHVEGHVRGILCNNCNLSLGLMKDRVDWFSLAIVYLKKHKKRPTSGRRSRMHVKGIFEIQAGSLNSFDIRQLLNR